MQEKKVLDLEQAESIICPICDSKFPISMFLKEKFKSNSKSLWFANMVTHYRHNHITSWNKCWGNNGSYYRKGWFGNYEEEKHLVNERAKRQIIRKAKAFLIHNEFSIEDIKELKGTEQKTIDLFNKLIIACQ